MRIFKCNWCQELFWDKPRKYCSRECLRACLHSRKKAESSLTRAGNTQYAYRKFRKEILQKRKYRCELCGGKADLIHHLKPVSQFPSLELAASNVILVCLDCHIKYHPELPRRFMENSLYYQEQNDR